jgi:hypothetical protein
VRNPRKKLVDFVGCNLCQGLSGKSCCKPCKAVLDVRKPGLPYPAAFEVHKGRYSFGNGLAVRPLSQVIDGELDRLLNRPTEGAKLGVIERGIALIDAFDSLLLSPAKRFILCDKESALSGFSTGSFRSLTTRVENKALATCLSEQNLATANSGLATATLELLACATFGQPISHAEIDQVFDVEEFPGADGRLHFAITEQFLRHLSLTRLQELATTQRSGNSPAIQPFRFHPQRKAEAVHCRHLAACPNRVNSGLPASATLRTPKTLSSKKHSGKPPERRDAMCVISSTRAPRELLTRYRSYFFLLRRSLKLQLELPVQGISKIVFRDQRKRKPLIMKQRRPLPRYARGAASVRELPFLKFSPTRTLSTS